MEIEHARCCGIDVHKATVCGCISIKDGATVEKYKQRFDTTTAQLRELVEWLHRYQVTKVAMEATGVYWKPVPSPAPSNPLVLALFHVHTR